MVKKILIWIIKKYQKWISPRIGNHCKYYPTCSEYTKQAIERYGAFKGSWIRL